MFIRIFCHEIPSLLRSAARTAPSTPSWTPLVSALLSSRSRTATCSVQQLKNRTELCCDQALKEMRRVVKDDGQARRSRAERVHMCAIALFELSNLPAVTSGPPLGARCIPVAFCARIMGISGVVRLACRQLAALHAVLAMPAAGMYCTL